MSSKNVVIGNIMDNYDNPIAELVNVACHFDSNITFANGTKRINAKSIMGMMAFPMQKGVELGIVAEGTDEERALQAMEQFLVC